MMKLTIDTDRADDRDILMLIDYLADQLSSDLSDDFPLLTDQFAAIEEGRSYSPSYPGGTLRRQDWRDWRAYRDWRVATMFGEKA